MAKASRSWQRLVANPVPAALFDAPIEYLLAEHARQRALCSALQEIAAAGAARRKDAAVVARFLRQDCRLHHADEDQDLFPAVRRRALPEDNLAGVLATLSDDHRRSEMLSADIVDILSGHPDDDPIRIDEMAAGLMRRYADSEQRHLAIENAVVLAIAAIRLTRKDMKAISETMKARRGVPI